VAYCTFCTSVYAVMPMHVADAKRRKYDKFEKSVLKLCGSRLRMTCPGSNVKADILFFAFVSVLEGSLFVYLFAVFIQTKKTFLKLLLINVYFTSRYVSRCFTLQQDWFRVMELILEIQLVVCMD